MAATLGLSVAGGDSLVDLENRLRKTVRCGAIAAAKSGASEMPTADRPQAPNGPTTNGAIDFVIKISKYCNLRCSYCYEFEELGQRRRMGLDELRAFFTNVRDTVIQSGRSRIHFVWHGGEPLLVPLEYYERIGDIQREVLGEAIDYANL